MPRGYNNYSFVVDSSFSPLTMQEMLVPFTAYKEAYEKDEAAYQDLYEKADKFKYLSETLPEGSKARQIYEGYANELKSAADDFSANGKSMSNSRALLGLKRRYSGEIGRLAEADAARKAQIAEQQKIALQDPTRLFSREAAMSSLDDYLENSDLSYKSYSGALLAQQVGSAASAIAKSLSDYGNGKPLDQFTKTWLQQNGLTAAEVAQAINNPNGPGSNAVLNTLVQNVIDNSRIADWADPATLNQAYAYARSGLWNAVGQTTLHQYTDEGAKLAAQEAMHKRLAEHEAELAAKLQGSPIGFEPEFDTRNVRTDKEVAEDTKDKEIFNKYRNYFVEDPENHTWKMTEEGKKAYNKGFEINVTSPTTGVSFSRSSRSNDFKRWVDAKGLTEMAQDKPNLQHSQILTGIANKTANLLDTHAAMEYIRGIGSENYDDVVSSLNRISTEGKVKNYKRVKEGGNYAYIPTDDVKVNELSNSDIKSAQVIYGDHGDFLEVNLKDGNTLLQPFQIISPTYSNAVTGNRSMIQRYLQAKQMGVEYIDDQSGRPIPIDSWINGELNSYGKNLSSSLSRTKVEPRKLEPGYYGTR